MVQVDELTDEDLGKELTCFIISPIGNKLAPPGTDQRSVYEDSIQLWEEVFQPVAAQFGMTAIRSDTISETGEIPEQICVLLRDADVVIADLTGGNANVMYELGLRHTVDKLTVPVGEYARLPFDINTIRTIQFKRTETGRIELRRALIETIRQGLSGRRSLVTATRVWKSETTVSSIGEALLVSPDIHADDDIESVELGYIDVLADGERAITEIVGVIERSTSAVDTMTKIYTESTEAVRRSDASGKGFAGKLKCAQELAVTLGPAADEYEEASSEYIPLLTLQDSAVKYLIGSVKGGDTPLEDVRPFFSAVIDLARVVVDDSVPSLTGFREANKNNSKIAGVLQPVTRKIDRSILRFLNGAEIIGAWRHAIEDIPGWLDPSAS